MKFIADGMLGGLCRLLRMLGIDCSFHIGSVEELVIKAKRERRIILSRNTRIKNREGVIFVSSSHLEDQLREINSIYNLKDIAQPLSRCLVCNREIEAVQKEDIKEEIPYYTYLHFDHFYRCPLCKRIYWDGTHRKGLEAKVNRILDVLD